jgi:hypothetical protein
MPSCMSVCMPGAYTHGSRARNEASFMLRQRVSIPAHIHESAKLLSQTQVEVTTQSSKQSLRHLLQQRYKTASAAAARRALCTAPKGPPKLQVPFRAYPGSMTCHTQARRGWGSRLGLRLPAYLSKQERARWHKATQWHHLSSQSQVSAPLLPESSPCPSPL